MTNGAREGEDVIVFNALKGRDESVRKIYKTDQEWQKELVPEAFRVTRKNGTERAHTGIYHKHEAKGIYKCISCGTDLFRSNDKFYSKSGWPSFTAPVDERNISTKEDNSFFMKRLEVLCRRCDAHLGHVFDDGPQPTGKRYCINSVSLGFAPGPE